MDLRRLRIVAALGSAQTLGWGSTYYLPAFLAAPMARDLGVSTGAIFAAFSMALVVAAVLGPGAGRRIDRLGGRQALAASSLVFAAGLATLGMAQGSAGLALGWFILGVGMSFGLYEAAFAALVGVYGRNARGAITGITLIAGFASTICWPITAMLEAQYGWREACFFWAAAHLLIGLPLNLTMPRGEGAVQPPSPAGPVSGGRREMALLAFVFGAAWFTSTAMAAHLPRMLQDMGATPAAALAAAALVGPAQVAGRLLEFGVLQRLHPLLSARLAAAAHPVGAVALLAAGAPAAAVFAIIHGAGNGILTIAKGALPLAIFGPVGYGWRQGVIAAPARFAAAAAPFLFALALDGWGVWALALTTALGLLALVALMALSAEATRPAE